MVNGSVQLYQQSAEAELSEGRKAPGHDLDKMFRERALVYALLAIASAIEGLLDRVGESRESASR